MNTKRATPHAVFVVAGYAAIGYGHFYRALMLAKEFRRFRVSFVCTRESEEAAVDLARRKYPVHVQRTDDLAAEILALSPDLVINDLLNTGAAYVRALQADGAAVVNFEDEGEGAALADLVVNALYEHGDDENPRRLCGSAHFCLRDEFALARRNPFRPKPERLLLTFGGTDFSDFTRQSLDLLIPLCVERGVHIRVVAGPGYAHAAALEARIAALDARLASFTRDSNVMASEMERADLAVCSAGRTVYELAHMRVPGVVLAHHSREDMHSFARPENGFLYLGVMRPFRGGDFSRAVSGLLQEDIRAEMHRRLACFDFSPNKARVVGKIEALVHGGA